MPIRYTLLMLMVIFGAGASFDSSSTYTIGAAPPGASQTDRDNDYYRPTFTRYTGNGQRSIPLRSAPRSP
jgi:hypothetical protein